MRVGCACKVNIHRYTSKVLRRLLPPEKVEWRVSTTPMELSSHRIPSLLQEKSSTSQSFQRTTRSLRSTHTAANRREMVPFVYHDESGQKNTLFIRRASRRTGDPRQTLERQTEKIMNVVFLLERYGRAWGSWSKLRGYTQYTGEQHSLHCI